MLVRIVCFLLLFLNSCLILSQAKTISEIKINGAKKLKTALILKIISAKEGDSLDTKVIANDIIRLKRIPPIANATYEVIPSASENVQLVFTIQENFTLIPFANLYTSSNDDFAFRVGLQEFNFLGRNITLGGFYQFDIFNSYGIGVRDPYLFSNKFGVAFNYKNFTTQEPVFFKEATADYKYNNKGFEILGLYEINTKNNIALGFSLFTEDYQYISGFTDENVPLALNVRKSLGKLIYNYEDLNYHYQYLNGFKSVLNLQYVQSTSEALPDFWIGFNDFLFYKRIGEKGNWANRIRLGLATNSESPFAPFTLDNNINIRGVGNTIDRGTGAIVINTEYRHTLIDKNWFVLQSNLFLDGGSWRNPGGELKNFTDKNNIRVYPGLGLRFMHKRIFNAIFRIDYGYGITKDASRGFVFGIGQYF
jgi:outer membrane protein insertion porin family